VPTNYTLRRSLNFELVFVFIILILNHYFFGQQVVIEGNIGSGKTTLLNFFLSKYGDRIKCFSEPVDKWRSLRGNNLFSIMYQDPKRWAFAFQQYVQLTMMKVHEETQYKQNTGYCCLMERSLFSARYCFVENLYRK